MNALETTVKPQAFHLPCGIKTLADLQKTPDWMALKELPYFEDLEGRVVLNLLEGLPLEKAFKNARALEARVNRPTGWVSMDTAMDGDHSFHETITAYDVLGADEPSDDFMKTLPESRANELSEQGEKAIAFVSQGSLKLSEAGGINGGKVSQRRMQQLLKAAVERVRDGNAFRAGEGGGTQGELIDFNGNVVAKDKAIATAKKAAALLFTKKQPNGATEKAQKRAARLLKEQADASQGGLFESVVGVDKENQ